MAVPGLPHHATQRGNRREPVFFRAGDYQLYCRLIAATARRRRGDLGVLSDAQSCPPDRDADRPGWAAATFAEAHRRYTGAINARFQWTGHLFRGRFGAVVMDEPHLLAATRYIAVNPVAAGLGSRAEDWPWSSARAHLRARMTNWQRGPITRAARFCCASHGTGRSRDDGSDRAGTDDRTAARPAPGT